MRAFLIVALLAGTADAGEHDTQFATQLDLAHDAVHDVRGFELPAGGDLTHVLVGRFDSGAAPMTAAVLLKCDGSQCSGRRAEFGTADAIEVLGIVDLQGEPGPVPSRALPADTKISGRKMKFPALVIRTRESKQVTGKVTGRETRAKIYVVSLLESDRGSIVLMDSAEERSASGAGMTRSYRLERGGAKSTNLDVVATEKRRGCPSTIEDTFSLEDHHYRNKSYGDRTGC